MNSAEQLVDASFQDAYAAFYEYVSALERLADAMAVVGIPTRNVDPFANFAEVVIAREMGGTIQRATNEGFDVLTAGGIKVQVKSLRVSSDKPEDNGRGWYECTRKAAKADAPLIDADQLAIVVYLDFRPYAAILFPVEHCDRFPIINVKDMMFRHVQKFLEAQVDLAGTGVRVIDYRENRQP